MITLTPGKAVQTAVHFLNQPVVKEGIKNIAGSVTFAIGIVEVYDVYQILKGREISTEVYEGPKWMQVANKTAVACAKVSLLLSAGTTRPGVYLISTLTGAIFSTAQLNRVFGPNTIFAINPWHPRHVASIAAALLALPEAARSVYKGVRWSCRKISRLEKEQPKGENSHWMTDLKLRIMVLFNTLTSRPLLHLGNQFARFALRRS